MRIEEQGKRLQKMFEDQLKASGNTASAAYPVVVLFLPPPATAPSEQEDNAVFVDVIDEVQVLVILSYEVGNVDAVVVFYFFLLPQSLASSSSHLYLNRVSAFSREAFNMISAYEQSF